MCGVFGWVLPAARRQDQQLLARLTDMLAHRGPDGSGTWLGLTASESHQIGFGHRRLAIIDLSAAGAQPMFSANGALSITFNGEIYNYLELREELAALGHRFNTETDTEVLLAAHEQWGTDCLPKLRGMFAFALWDSRRQHLIFARDPFGKKPLYLWEGDGQLLFSSEIAPLLKFPAVSRELDRGALPQYLFNRYVPGPQTMFKGIRKLEPGSVAIWSNGTISTQRYFVPPHPSKDRFIPSYEQAVREFSDTLDAAVRVRMRCDAPYGAYLSGGIDSSAVVATMSRHSTAPVRTFAAGFREKEYSELAPAREIARRLGTNHEEVIIDPDNFVAEWESAIIHRGAPVSENADLIIAQLSKIASHSVRMVLTGEGADEILGGYPKYRAEPVITALHKVLPAFAIRLLVPGLSQLLPYSMARLETAAQALAEHDPDRRLQTWFGGISSRDYKNLLGGDHPPRPPGELPFSARTGSRFRDMLFFDQTLWLPDNLLERGDRMMMLGSIEGRMPFMDVEMAKLVARFPDRFLIGHGRTKCVLRDAMKSILPASTLTRRKIGFRVPVGQWFQGPMQDLLRDLLTSGTSRVAVICSKPEIDRLVREHIGRHKNHERTLWSLATLELFLRTFDFSVDALRGQ